MDRAGRRNHGRSLCAGREEERKSEEGSVSEICYLGARPDNSGPDLAGTGSFRAECIDGERLRNLRRSGYFLYNSQADLEQGKGLRLCPLRKKSHEQERRQDAEGLKLNLMPAWCYTCVMEKVEISKDFLWKKWKKLMENHGKSGKSDCFCIEKVAIFLYNHYIGVMPICLRDT